jgi:serine/threonine protein kinase
MLESFKFGYFEF